MRWVLVLGMLMSLAAAGQSASVVEAPESLGPVLAQAQKGSTLYLALEAGGIAVVEAAARPWKVLTRIGEGRIFSRLVIDGDVLLALELKEEAAAFSLADPLRPTLARLGSGRVAVAAPVSATEEPKVAGEVPVPAPLPAPLPAIVPAAAPPGSKQVRVTSVTDGRVLFEGGAAEGFAKGQRIRIFSQRKVKKPDVITGKPVDSPSGLVTAVLEVEDAQEHRAMAVLGRGDYAEVGDLVEVTSLPVSERLVVPRRAPFEFRAGFVLRPFLGLEGQSKPVGFLVDGYVQWYLPQAPVVLALSGAPLGVAINTVEAHYPGVIAFTGAYTTDFFEIGLGIGALYGNPGPCNFATGCEVNTGFTINQVLRLGALDGLHLEWNSSIFSRPDRFVFGVGRGAISVPLGSRLGLFLAGGAGENGWGQGEFGVRTALGGAGGRGTLILSASLGVGALFDGPTREMILGPAVAFGMEWRL